MLKFSAGYVKINPNFVIQNIKEGYEVKTKDFMKISVHLL